MELRLILCDSHKLEGNRIIIIISWVWLQNCIIRIEEIIWSTSQIGCFEFDLLNLSSTIIINDEFNRIDSISSHYSSDFYLVCFVIRIKGILDLVIWVIVKDGISSWRDKRDIINGKLECASNRSGMFLNQWDKNRWAKIGTISWWN